MHVCRAPPPKEHDLRETKFDSARPVAFMHIGKAGGTALHSALGRAFNLPDATHYLDRSNYGGYDDFASWHPDAFKRMIFLPQSGGIDKTAPYIAGHISLSTIRDNVPDAQVVTVVREPISRLLSSWVFGRAAYDVYPEYMGSWGKMLASVSLPDLLTNPGLASNSDNRIARTVLSPHPLIPENGFIAPDHDDELVEEALKRLESFAVVGVYEDKNYVSHFEKFLERELPIKRENETTFIRSNLSFLHDDLNAQTFDLLNQRCRLDTRIWEEYCKKYGMDFEQIRSVNLLKNTARFSLLLSGFHTLHRERDFLMQKVQQLEQTLNLALQTNSVLAEAAFKKDPNP